MTLVHVLDPSTGLTHMVPARLKAVRNGLLPLVDTTPKRAFEPVPEPDEEPVTELPDDEPEDTTTEYPNPIAGITGTDIPGKE